MGQNFCQHGSAFCIRSTFWGQSAMTGSAHCLQPIVEGEKQPPHRLCRCCILLLCRALGLKLRQNTSLCACLGMRSAGRVEQRLWPRARSPTVKLAVHSWAMLDGIPTEVGRGVVKRSSVPFILFFFISSHTFWIRSHLSAQQPVLLHWTLVYLNQGAWLVGVVIGWGVCSEGAVVSMALIDGQ